MKSVLLILEILRSEQTRREQRKELTHDPVNNHEVPRWVLDERSAILTKVNELRAEHGFSPVEDSLLVRFAECPATGHVDYSTKYAMYAAELTRQAEP